MSLKFRNHILSSEAGQKNAVLAPINELIRDQDPVSLSIPLHVNPVNFPTWLAVMRISLAPLPRDNIKMINVVPKSIPPAATKVRLLALKTSVLPILVKTKCFTDPHSIYGLSLSLLAGGTSPQNPVPNLGADAHLWLTGGQSTHTEKWIRGKPHIPRYNVSKESSQGSITSTATKSKYAEEYRHNPNPNRRGYTTGSKPH